MNSYKYHTVDDQLLQLKKCEKPDCKRLTSALYCCGQCSLADKEQYEIPESGILNHSATCNERHEKRKNLKP